MTVLLAYNEFDNGTKYYLIPDAPEWLIGLHGKYTNCTEVTEEENDLLIRLSDALCDNPEWCLDPGDPIACSWDKHKITPPCPIPDGATLVESGLIP